MSTTAESGCADDPSSPPATFLPEGLPLTAAEPTQEVAPPLEHAGIAEACANKILPAPALSLLSGSVPASNPADDTVVHPPQDALTADAPPKDPLDEMRAELPDAPPQACT